MLFAAFWALARQLLVIVGILAACATIVWITSGEQAATDLIRTAIVGMNGPWVWTFGFGLATFVQRQGRILPLDVSGVLEANEATAELVSRIDRSTRHRHALWYTIPVLLLGALLTSAYGIPNTGVAYAMIFGGVCAIYYIAAFLLCHFVETTLAFHQLSESADTVEFMRVYSPLHLENLTSYLAISTTIGVLAIYAGFRGTLTAGFVFPDEVWRSFLTTPLILFLPATLIYNYYPRYVLRKLLQHKVFQTMERLGRQSDGKEAQALILDLRETTTLSSQILPFLDYKSLPSYLLAIFFAISLVYNNDPAVKGFLDYVLRLGASR